MSGRAQTRRAWRLPLTRLGWGLQGRRPIFAGLCFVTTVAALAHYTFWEHRFSQLGPDVVLCWVCEGLIREIDVLISADELISLVAR
jgi:hypothetical protein